MSECNGSRWCHGRGKRAFDLAASALLLLPALPAMAGVALAVKLSSPGPVLFRQVRAGVNGNPITLVKFRSMRPAAESNGSGVTMAGDDRITPIGRVLRNWKLDELPQLFSVLRGDLSLVGPRPDLPRYWAQADAGSRRVLALKPGITGQATLCFRNEEELLRAVAPENVEGFYVAELLPKKAAIDLRYAESATLVTDLYILLRTVTALLQRKAPTPPECTEGATNSSPARLGNHPTSPGVL